ncbi:SusD-like starch-binding protein associating with outer membrane [Gillisia sp. Hel_I_86]|uniref:SusD/RagB family nutrient-binding outer membrane lipoprotein n=1 Tax=Gillisia sp. Hel_I_86 TaxID=1249981 RepID=UPI0011995C7E|nr:SusD/RagB family nutrient-binding outer membrane lipoprotein [Gillisia sp. Hel_I_86]TVZ27645.1 SusD-like starch-binding protein associating with outer membrane [Gillisia sp. Hel_I_86]
MKSIYIKYVFVFTTILLSSCESMVENLNDNPNQLTLDAIDPGLFLNGAEIANINIHLGSTVSGQRGALNRIGAYYSGQLVGFEQVDYEWYQYNVTNRTFNWDGYQSVITPLREMRGRTTENPLYQGISKILEAHLMGTYASLFGDIPYAEAVSDVEEPKFDDQRAIFDALQILLQDAIVDLENASGSVIIEDFIFDGNRIKWLESAWTLKARYYMHTKQYDLAYAAAQNGISSNGNSMMFNPLDIPGENTTKNKFYIVLSGGPNTGTGNSYLIQLLDNASGISRNNAKTDETARLGYYTIDPSSPNANLGIAHELEPQPLITYQENLLILAEAGARTQSFATGLVHLNGLRSFLNTGAFLNSNFSTEPYSYDAYVASDFDAGGMENMDNINPDRALLREIIEERYISGFTTLMPFDDARRLKKSDMDVAVPFPLNVPTATQNVERFLYPEDEILSNLMAPVDPGLYSATEVNQ